MRVQAGSVSGQRIKLLAVGDAHDDPETSKERFEWFGRAAVDEGCDRAVFIGDVGSIDSLNTHAGNHTLLGKSKNPFSIDMGSLNEAYQAFNHGLGSHTLVERHVTDGNHERRIWFYENEHPEMAGSLVSEYLHTVESNGFKRSPYGEYHFIGGVGFIHCAINRLNKSYGGKNAEVTIGNDAVFDHVIGHSHVKREHRAIKLGPSKHVTVLNLGCALPWGRVESYMYHGALTGWWWGVHTITIQNGQITDASAISCTELERRYGRG